MTIFNKYFIKLKKWLNINKSIIIWSFCSVLLWRITVELVNIIQNHSFFSTKIDTTSHGWVAWDGFWYLSILENGYLFNGDLHIPSNVAFFPGFPILVKVGSLFGLLDSVLVGLFFNVILTFLSVFLIYKITLLLSEKHKINSNFAAKISTVLFLSFPSSFFLAAFYAEALLVLAFSATIYFALTNKFFLSGLFILIGTATKSISIVLIPTVILIDWLRRKNKSSILLVNYSIITFIGILGIFLYALYLKINYSSFLLFNRIQIAWARQITVDSVPNLWSHGYKNLFNPGFFEYPFLYFTSLLSMLLPIMVLGVIVFYSLKFRTYWMIALCGLLIIIPFSTGLIHSMNRYIMMVVPFFSVCGILLSKIKISFSFIVITISTILMLVSCFGFLTGKLFAG